MRASSVFTLCLLAAIANVSASPITKNKRFFNLLAPFKYIADPLALPIDILKAGASAANKTAAGISSITWFANPLTPIAYMIDPLALPRDMLKAGASAANKTVSGIGSIKGFFLSQSGSSTNTTTTKRFVNPLRIPGAIYNVTTGAASTVMKAPGALFNAGAGAIKGIGSMLTKGPTTTTTTSTTTTTTTTTTPAPIHAQVVAKLMALPGTIKNATSTAYILDFGANAVGGAFKGLGALAGGLLGGPAKDETEEKPVAKRFLNPFAPLKYIADPLALPTDMLNAGATAAQNTASGIKSTKEFLLNTAAGSSASSSSSSSTTTTTAASASAETATEAPAPAQA